ncbi:hypothetical protein GGI21_003812, partial [Coemansia aciculifera]
SKATAVSSTQQSFLLVSQQTEHCSSARSFIKPAKPTIFSSESSQAATKHFSHALASSSKRPVDDNGPIFFSQGCRSEGHRTLSRVVERESRHSAGGLCDPQGSLEQQRQFLLNEHALRALYTPAANVEGFSPTTCHSADPDYDLLTFITTPKATSTADYNNNNNSLYNNSFYNNYSYTTTTTKNTKNSSYTNNTTSATTATANYTHNMDFSFDDQSQFGSSVDDQLIGSLFAPDFYSPADLQLHIEAVQPSRTSRSLPDLHRTVDVSGAPLLSDVFSTEAFTEALARPSSSSAPATPTRHQAASDMLADVQNSAYDSFLNTPMNAEYFTSPNVNVSTQHVLPSSSHMLFAPLDEFGAKDSASPWTEDDLLAQLITSNPGIRHDFVHALVNHISPTVAYRPIDRAAAASASSSSVIHSLEALGMQDSYLGLLSPVIDTTETPPMTAATASLPVLELVSPSVPVATAAADEDDVPLLKRKWSVGADSNEGEDLSPSPSSSSKRTAKASDRFYCEICNRGFARHYNMLSHRLTHDPKSKDARPHACEHCPRTFTRKHDLQRHQVTHDDSKAAYKCSVCNHGFAREDVRDRHMAALHKP